MKTISCQSCHADFSITPDDQAFYEKMNVPMPTWCPHCRLVRRASWRNERSLYKNTCAVSGKDTISVIAPQKEYKTVSMEVWWSDQWDPMAYGHEYDFSKTFFEQFDNLLKTVPLMALYNATGTLEYSQYVNMSSYLKNSYMVTNTDYGEQLLYGSYCNASKDSVDNLMVWHSEFCYESVGCFKCYKAFWSLNCSESRDIYFSRDCVNCSDCFGCVNLRNKSYCIWNEQKTKEEYLAFMAAMVPWQYDQIEQLKQQAADFWSTFPVRYMQGVNNNNVSGDHIYNSKNAEFCYISSGLEDCKYCALVPQEGGGSRDCYDLTHCVVNNELCYESIQSGHHVVRGIGNYLAIMNCSNVAYCAQVVGCQDCFGCVGLHKKRFCIFNKQYTESEYYALREKIIQHMNENTYQDALGRMYAYGDFFPSELSPFGYNETTAGEWFPLEKQSAEQQGFSWFEKPVSFYNVTLLASDLPPDITGVTDALLSEVIACEATGEPFRIVVDELDFYRRMKLPIPRLHPNVRHKRRTQFRNPPKFYERTTQDGEKVITTYAPDRPEKIYSEKGYQDLIL